MHACSAAAAAGATLRAHPSQGAMQGFLAAAPQRAHGIVPASNRHAQARPERRSLVVAAAVDFSVRPYTLRSGDTLDTIAKKRGELYGRHVYPLHMCTGLLAV